MKRHCVLAFDIATRTGWVVASLDSENTITSHHEGFVHFGSDSYGLRFLRARQFFTDIISKFRPIIVAYEMVDKPKGHNAQLYPGYLSQLLVACEEKGVTYIGYSISTWKKHVAGKGNATKEEVAEAVEHKLGLITTDYDISDAAGVLLTCVTDCQNHTF